MEPIFRPRRMGHVNYWVDDWRAAAKWHYDIAGLQEVYRRTDLKGAFLSNGNTYHDSAVFDLDTPRGKGQKPGLHHLAFELENEVELVEGYNRLNEYGFKFDFTLTADIAHCCYGRDPDGNRFEVYTDVLDDWRNRRNGDVDASDGRNQWAPGDTPPVAESCYPVNPPIERVDEAVLHTKKASHATLVASDYKTIYRHYTDLVGLTPLVGGPDTPFSILTGTVGEQSLAIFAPIPGVPTGLHHGSFELNDPSDLDNVEAKLRERGADVERVVEHGARRSVFVRDINGSLIQYYLAGKEPLSAIGKLKPADALWVA
jgi:catechol 2,3-dioxygenase